MMTQPNFRFGTFRLIRDAVLGTGSYGQVCRAMLDELPCAAKLLHPTLVDAKYPRNREKFEQECRYLSEIRHPNIVQYLGVMRDEISDLPILVMELMDDSLTHFLEQSGSPLPYRLQVDITHDIALALAFLHSNNIIHRDLSSNNVLLSGGGSRAKVTDFGMSKLMELNSRKADLTRCPGTSVCMAPEALLDPPVYSEKLDSFQVGVLIVQTITRKYPDPGQAMNRVRDTRYPTGWTIFPVPETERRRNHLRLIPQTHPLLKLAVTCLKDVDKERPSAKQICQNLLALKKTPQYIQSFEQREKQIEDIQRLVEENQSRIREVQEKEKEIRKKDKEIERLRNELQQREEDTQQKRRNVVKRMKEIKSLHHELQQKVNEVLGQMTETQEGESEIGDRKEIQRVIKESTAVVPSVQTSLQHINREVVWVDPNIGNTENSSYVHELKQEWGVSLFATASASQALDALKNKKEGREYRVITSGTGGEEFVHTLRRELRIKCKVLVFCMSVDYHKTWARKYDNVDVTLSGQQMIEFATWTD